MQLSKFPLDNFASRKFADSPTGRGYLEADIKPDPATATMKPIRVATTQLERPTPPAPMRFLERHAQARHAVAALGGGGGAANVVLGGDMSWGDAVDGPFPLAAGWVDAWAALRSGARAALLICGGGWTHDAGWNEEAAEFNGHFDTFYSMKKRPDRFLCKLRDYRLRSIQLIGDRSVGSTSYRSRRADSFIDLKPSCHRGVVLTIVPK
ncbi:unnamed protein product [Urochloa decumbens]|uniref:Uncharacterized protein n=1 Tax=Urochloa decumbens TaxID=240449 RepID=A0ABC9ETT7_9POAL